MNSSLKYSTGTVPLPLIARKFKPLSVAKALAIIVLEHPGGPNINTPLGGVIPRRWKLSGCLRGHSTA